MSVSLGTQREPAVQPVDWHLAEVAAAHRGVYELAGDGGRQDVARFAGRRLRELERVGLVASPGARAMERSVGLARAAREATPRGARSLPAFLEALPSGSTRRSAIGGPSGSTRSMRRVWRRRGSAPRSSRRLERRRQVLRELGIAPGRSPASRQNRRPRRVAVGREMARQSGQEFLENAPTRFGAGSSEGRKAPPTWRFPTESDLSWFPPRARRAPGRGNSSRWCATLRTTGPRRGAGPSPGARTSGGWRNVRARHRMTFLRAYPRASPAASSGARRVGSPRRLGRRAVRPRPGDARGARARGQDRRGGARCPGALRGPSGREPRPRTLTGLLRCLPRRLPTRLSRAERVRL